jgi:hypothetical protein
VSDTTTCNLCGKELRIGRSGRLLELVGKFWVQHVCPGPFTPPARR